MRTLHDFDGKIIGYINDVGKEVVIYRGNWKAIIVKDGEGQCRDVTNPPVDFKEKTIRATIGALFDMGMIDAAIVPGPDPSPVAEEDMKMIREKVDKKLGS